MKRWMIGLAVVVLAVGMVTQGSSAAVLLGTTGTGGVASMLVELDSTTGAWIRDIGSVGFAVNGLSFDNTTGTLFASTSTKDPNYTGLIEIDVTNGTGMAIGLDGWGLPAPVWDPYTSVTNITLSSSGEMFGWWEPFEDDLVSIDKTTGIATRVGESGLNTGKNGLAFDSSDTLYMVNGGGSIYTVNTSTGAATFSDSLGGTAHHGDFELTTDTYVGIDANLTGSKNLVVANLSTGEVIATLPTVDNLHTVAFIPDNWLQEEWQSKGLIPEPSTLVIWSLLAAIGITVGWYRKRRAA